MKTTHDTIDKTCEIQNDLIRISQLECSLSRLEREIGDIRLELEQIKKEAAITSAPDKTYSDNNTAASQSTKGAVQKAVVSPASTVRPASHPASSPQKSAFLLEENLGGKIMGIVAAILTFIGLLLFGSVLYEHLGDTARILLLFLISFLLLGAGLFLDRKHPSRFTTSLTGCGFGAAYISLFITSLYYERISTELLYLLLVLWLIATGLYVFRRGSCIVALLGQAGITFSVIFGSIGVTSTGLFHFLIVYFILLSLSYIWIVLWRFLPTEQKKPHPWIFLTAAVLNLIPLGCLTSAYSRLFGEAGAIGGKNWFGGILLCLYCLVFPLFLLLRHRLLAKLPLLPYRGGKRIIDSSTLPVYRAGVGTAVIYSIYQIMCSIVFAIVCKQLFPAIVPYTLVLFVSLLLSQTLLEVFGATGTEGYGACIVTALTLLFLLFFGNLPPLLHFLLPAAFSIHTLYFGLLGTEAAFRQVRSPKTGLWEFVCRETSGRCLHQFMAPLFLLPILFFYNPKNGFGLFCNIAVFGVLFLTGCFVFLYRNGRTRYYADAWKKELYLLSLLYTGWVAAILCDFSALSDFGQQTIVFMVLTLLNSIAFYCGFRTSLEVPERSDNSATILIRCTHAGLWIWGLSLLHDTKLNGHPLLCLLLLLFTLYLCCSGMYEQYRRFHSKPGLGVYFGLRFTAHLIAVLTAFEGIAGYAISCALLLLAIAAILAGFPLRLAALRIYGLCLAMFAVIKLLMADIKHDNSMETVLCFLGAGILCFAINFIYNHVKKRFQNDAV